jgi:hypothetical protein
VTSDHSGSAKGDGGVQVDGLDGPQEGAIDHTALRAEFDALGPWITRFEIDGEAFGGWYDAASGSDERLQQFLAAFPHARSVLELGCLEGGHTAAIARLLDAPRVVGIEGRSANVDRARHVMRTLGLANVEIRQADLETLDLAASSTTCLGRGSCSTASPTSPTGCTSRPTTAATSR